MSISRKWIAGAVSLGLGISYFSSMSLGAQVTENFNDDPATDADPNTNWIKSGTASYDFQSAGNMTGDVPTGPGEAGGASGSGGYYGDNFNNAGVLTLNDAISVSGTFFLGGNEGGALFGYVNSSSVPLPTDPRNFNPAQFLGFRTNSGDAGHAIELRIGDTTNGDSSNILNQTAFNRPPSAGEPGNVLFNTIHTFALNYDPGTAAGPNFGSLSLQISGGIANADIGGDDGAADKFTVTFADAAGRPNPAGIAFNLLAMFGAEGQTFALDDLNYTSPVPEPASLGLLGLGSLLMLRRRRSM
jgi:hypothetical protein